jgi:DNA-binding NarL/FixJ family response regulator
MSRAQEKTAPEVAPLDPIRVLLVGLSGILGEIIRDSVAHQLDMDIVAELPDARELTSAARRSRCDAMIIESAEGGELPPAGRELLGRWPSVAILVLSADGRHAEVHHARRGRVRLEDPSSTAMMDALRAAVGPRPPDSS